LRHSDDDEEEDEEAELMRELEKIKRERAEQRAKEVRILARWGTITHPANIFRRKRKRKPKTRSNVNMT
jgi:hypothetical protein